MRHYQELDGRCLVVRHSMTLCRLADINRRMSHCQIQCIFRARFVKKSYRYDLQRIFLIIGNNDELTACQFVAKNQHPVTTYKISL